MTVITTIFQSALARGVGAVFALKVGAIVVALGTQVLLARLLGVSDFGIYAYALAWLQVLLVLGVMGLDTLTVRYTAEYRATSDWAGLRGLIAAPVRWIVAISIGIAVLAALVIGFLKSTLQPDQARVLWTACVAIPLVTLTMVKLAALRGLKRILTAEFAEGILRNVLLGAAVVLLYFTTGAVTAAQAMDAYLGVSVVILTIVALWVRAALPKGAISTQPRTDAPRWLRTALPLWGIALMAVLLNRVDVLMLGAMIGPEASGIYTAVARLAELAGFGLIAANAFIAPRIAELYRAGKQRELQVLITWSARGIAVFTLFAAAGLALGGKFALGLFGPEFIVAYDALLILVCGQIFNGLCGSVGLILTMTGHERQAAKIMFGSALLNVALNALLIPLWGMVGAALATATTLIIWNIWMLIVVVRQLGMNPTFYASHRQAHPQHGS